ncbi:hypothetical protein E2320_006870 [Naja naja]|nr:hypothetical protein E2320_006870 [Naja naja]
MTGGYSPPTLRSIPSIRSKGREACGPHTTRRFARRRRKGGGKQLQTHLDRLRCVKILFSGFFFFWFLVFIPSNLKGSLEGPQSSGCNSVDFLCPPEDGKAESLGLPGLVFSLEFLSMCKTQDPKKKKEKKKENNNVFLAKINLGNLLKRHFKKKKNSLLVTLMPFKKKAFFISFHL